jgi:hypothetical protein
MRHPTRGTAALAALSLALLASACNKGPAEEAILAVGQELTAATPEIERYAPGELPALTGALQGARSELERGNYTAALKAAQGLPAQIHAALAKTAVQKGKLLAAWNELSGSLPGQVQALTGKLSGLADAKALPRGMTPETLASAQTDLASVTGAWAEASAAFEGGDLPRALRTAQDVKAKADALAGLLGLAPAPAAGPAPARAAPAPARAAPAAAPAPANP